MTVTGSDLLTAGTGTAAVLSVILTYLSLRQQRVIDHAKAAAERQRVGVEEDRSLLEGYDRLLIRLTADNEAARAENGSLRGENGHLRGELTRARDEISRLREELRECRAAEAARLRGSAAGAVPPGGDDVV